MGMGRGGAGEQALLEREAADHSTPSISQSLRLLNSHSEGFEQ